MPAFTLYGKTDCHLCDDARALLSSLGLVATETDISMDPDLQRRYGTRIPVLRSASGIELDWPFGPADLKTLQGRS